MFQSIIRPLSCSVDKQFLLRLGSKFFNFFKKAFISSKFLISGNETQAVTENLKNLSAGAVHWHLQNCKYNIRAMSFEQFDLFHILAFDLTSMKTSQRHYNRCFKSAKTIIFLYGLDKLGVTAMIHVS